MRPVPRSAVDLIRRFEGCRLTIYPDSAGLPTIGIGHLIRPGEDFSSGITTEEAENLLRSDLWGSVRAVNRLIKRSLTDNQYAALISFTFNAGAGALQSSTLRQKCNRGEDELVPDEFLRWNKVKDRRTGLYRAVRGLTNRRMAEATLYRYGE